MKTYRISLEVRVTDEQALLGAALKHAMEVDNLSEDFAREVLTNGSGSINVESCLQMIFDPGESPDGTEIEDSSVDAVHSTDPPSSPDPLAALCDETATDPDDWVVADGPDSGVGEDYYFDHKSDGRHAYVNVDQDSVSVNVYE